MIKVGNVIKVLNAVGTTQIGKGYFVPGVSKIPEYGRSEDIVVEYSPKKAREVISELRKKKPSKLNVLTQNNVPLEISIDDRCVVILSGDKEKGKIVKSALEGTGFNFRYPTEPDDDFLKDELLS